MRLNIRTTAWLALALAALLAGTAVADDRDFLRKLAAPPNLIFILDTSGSMIGSPEEPGYQMNSTVPYGMVPGGGDDYYSRMGIAKRVIKLMPELPKEASALVDSVACDQPSSPGLRNLTNTQAASQFSSESVPAPPCRSALSFQVARQE